MNPCPCGYYGDSRNECTCTVPEIMRYRSKLSGPLLDRIDMTINVKVPEYNEIHQRKKGMSSVQLKKAVVMARKIQQERYKNCEISYNSQMKSEHIKEFCILESDAENLMEKAFENLSLSVRSYDRILKVSRTIADMENSKNITINHVAEAISYKCEKEFFK